jgi:inner membrane protein
MMAVTHCLISATGVILVLGESSPLIVGAAILGSQLPDIDTTESAIGRLLFPLARFIEDRFPHRSITHSLLFTVGIAIASIPLYLYVNQKVALALPLGHLLAILSDTFTKQGVQLLYPSPVWCITGSNPNARLSTGSTGEFWLIGLTTIALMIALNIQLDGGLMKSVDKLLGLQDGVVNVYNTTGKTNHIFVKVQGITVKDRSPIDKEYYLIGAGEKQLILADSKGIYKTEVDIIPKRLISRVGGNATTKLDILNFNEEELFSKLVEIYQSNKNSLIYLSGNLTVDSPEEINFIPTPNQLAPITVNGSTVTLEYCPIELAGRVLINQFVSGQLELKIIYPAPNLEVLK